MWKNGYAILPVYSIMNSISCPGDRQRQRYKVFLREGAQMNRLYDDTSLERLGRMYAGGGELTENIDAVCGAGTAEFASKAIDIYYMSRK